MKITLVRHGEPNYAIDSLTPKGFREAELLADRLCRMDVRDFYVSPLGRAQDTARPTLTRLNRTAETLPWLAEFRGQFVDPCSGEMRHSVGPRAPVLDDAAPVLRSAALARPSVVSERHRGRNLRRDRRGHGRAAGALRLRSRRRTIPLRAQYGRPHRAVLPFRREHGHSGPHAQPLAGGALARRVAPATSLTTLITEERRPGEVFFRMMEMGDTSHLYAGGEPVSHQGLYRERFEQPGDAPSK